MTREGGSTTRTVRIESTVDGTLQRLAEREGVSVNFLVNKALRKLVEWDSFAEKFGVVSIPSAMLDRMMEQLNEEQARELGRWVGSNLVREFLTFWFKEVSARTVVEGYPRLNAQYGRAFQYEEQVENGRWVIILKHGRGRRWSAYYEELVKAIFGELLQKEVAIEATEGQIVARFTLV
jgi:hypothetical protein